MNLERLDTPPAAPARPIDAHKGTFGTAIVLGGCERMIGAPALAASAAFRAGAGLVKLAVPESILPQAIALEPSATGCPWPASPERLAGRLDAEDPKGRGALAIGPGLGPAADRWSWGAAGLRACAGTRPAVLDADGLNHLALTGERRPAGPRELVMTPHPGEFARLAEPLAIEARPTVSAERPEAAARLATAHDAVVVLKGHRAIVSDGRRLFVNATGNPALATGGTGDVLTGLIAALLAQGLSAFDAACLGIHLHGLAADRWRGRWGAAGLLARELAAAIPGALEAHRRFRRA